MRVRLVIVISLWMLGFSSGLQGDEWPQFRGPGSTGVADGQLLPLKWSGDKNVLWKTKIPGAALSSPIVWGDKVFLTTAVTDKTTISRDGDDKKKGPGDFGPGKGGPGGKKGPGGFGPGGFGPGSFMAKPLLENLDSDKDSKLTKAELLAGVKRFFANTDKDKKGTLDDAQLAEGLNRILPLPPGFPGGPKGPPGGFGPGNILAAEIFKRADVKKNGKVTLDELTTAADKLFTELDKDKTGRLDESIIAVGIDQLFRAPPGGFGGGKPPDAVYRWHVYCLDRASGKVIWNKLALEGKPKIPVHQSNSYATETPVTDGERVYAYFGMHGLFCYDVAGKFLWKKDLGSFPTAMGTGPASSPTLDGERLFLQIDNEEKSFLVALNGKTGDELWRATRDERTNHCSPVIWKNKTRTELVTAGANKVRSYDPATGKVLWELAMGGKCSASPVGDAERLYVGCERGFGGGPGEPGGKQGGPKGGFDGMGGGGGLFAVRAGASGDITLKKGETSSMGVAWYEPKGGLEMASPIAYQGHLYVLSNRGGFVTCYDTTTGKQTYRERLPNGQGFWASPWAFDGKIFCLDSDGTTYVLQAGPAFKLLGENRVEGQFWASPAIARGSLILRSADTVYCIKRASKE